jgi:subtilisin family serine protease
VLRKAAAAECGNTIMRQKSAAMVVVVGALVAVACMQPSEKEGGGDAIERRHAEERSITVGNVVRARRALRGALRAIGVDSARSMGAGAGIVVAVIDTGVDARSPALRGRVLQGFDVRTGLRADHDDGGHGTWIASLIAGQRRGPGGTEGVASDATILPIRAAYGPTAAAASVAAGMDFAAGRADVVILPYSTSRWHDDLVAAIERTSHSGSVVVIAAGNRGLVSAVPVTRSALVVASIDERGDLEPYSGQAGIDGVVAPGGDGDPTGHRMLAAGPGGRLETVGGTSVSAAFVAGVVAIVRGANRQLTPPSVMACIRRTAKDLGPRGNDPAYGWGQIQASQAVRCATSGEWEVGRGR